jgi:AcrR family transcriptional regulator
MNWPPAHIKPLRSPAGDEIWDRIRQATMDLAIERGYYEFDVDDIVERADVSRAEFDARFSGRTDACDRTYEANNAEFDHSFTIPFLAAPSWREGLRAGADSAAEYLKGHRRERRYGELRMREGGPMEQAAKDRYLQRFVDMVDVGRCEMSDPEALTRKTAEGALGSIYGLMVHRLQQPDGEAEMSLKIIDDVMYLAVRPYVGDEAALEELTASERQTPTTV